MAGNRVAPTNPTQRKQQSIVMHLGKSQHTTCITTSIPSQDVKVQGLSKDHSSRKTHYRSRSSSAQKRLKDLFVDL